MQQIFASKALFLANLESVSTTAESRQWKTAHTNRHSQDDGSIMNAKFVSSFEWLVACMNIEAFTAQ